MPKIYMMIGIQGSGKSTISNKMKNKYNIPIISSDALRNEMPDLEESKVFPTLYKRCSEIVKNDGSLIFDATNITRGARVHFMDELKNNGVDFSKVEMIAYYFIPNREVSIERVKVRNKIKGERFLPIEVIDNFISRFEEPTLDEGFNEIIKIDVDGNIIE